MKDLSTPLRRKNHNQQTQGNGKSAGDSRDSSNGDSTDKYDKYLNSSGRAALLAILIVLVMILAGRSRMLSTQLDREKQVADAAQRKADMLREELQRMRSAGQQSEEGQAQERVQAREGKEQAQEGGETNAEGEENLNADADADAAEQQDLEDLTAAQENNYPRYEGEDEQEASDPALRQQLEPEPDRPFHDKLPASELCPGGVPRPEMFLDGETFKNSPYWRVPKEPLESYKTHHWATKTYEDVYARRPIRRHVPHLNMTLSPEVFVECFMNTGQPVIIKMDALKALGYKARVYDSVDSMLKDFPPKKQRNGIRKQNKYKANSLYKGTPDLAPALLALQSDQEKTKAGAYRNYPRNMKLSRSALANLDFGLPPYHNPRKRWQLSTMFMGGTKVSAATPQHNDCCDNFCAHLVGTKRWILSAPTETRYLNPRCFGGLCWSKATLPLHPVLGHDDKENLAPAELEALRTAEFEPVDVHAGEILYLPAAWFHAVYNLKPTVSLVHWVASGPAQLYVNETGLTGGRSNRKAFPCLPGQSKC